MTDTTVDKARRVVLAARNMEASALYQKNVFREIENQLESSKETNRILVAEASSHQAAHKEALETIKNLKGRVEKAERAQGSGFPSPDFSLTALRQQMCELFLAEGFHWMSGLPIKANVQRVFKGMNAVIFNAEEAERSISDGPCRSNMRELFRVNIFPWDDDLRTFDNVRNLLQNQEGKLSKVMDILQGRESQ
jgi:hypothetical protein